MNKEMIISSGDHDTRVAILEDDQVVEVFIERERSRGVVGNIYKGRVSKVLPGMQSSFIDIGLERDAFLYVSEVVNTVEEFDRLEAGEDEDDEQPVPAPSNPPTVPEGAAAAPGRRQRFSRMAGRVASAAPSGPSRDDREREKPEAKIEDLLKEGQEILVQVVKEPLGTKGARLTSHVTMPGRFWCSCRPWTRRRSAQDRIAKNAPPARDRQVVPRAAWLHRRRHHPDRRFRPLRRGHRQRPVLVPPDLDRDPPEDGGAPACSAVPGTEPGGQAAARSAHRRLHGDSDRRRAGASEVIALVERIMPALLPRVKLYTKTFPIFEERRPGGNRQGAAQQGVAEVRRLSRDQPDRGAGG